MSSTSSPVARLSTAATGQILAGAGAVLCLLFTFSIVLPAVGVALMLLGVVIAAPEASDPGPYMVEWWAVLGFACLACLAGFGLGFAVEEAGNILLAAGGVTALVAAGLGFPAGRAG